MPAFAALDRRVDARVSIVALIIAALALRAAIVLTSSAALVEDLHPHLPMRLVEFAWGVGVAKLYLANRAPPAWVRGAHGFALGVVVVLVGRVVMTADVAATHPTLSALAGEPLLSFGYALLLWNVVSGPSRVVDALATKPVQAVGRWSYSLYLWHWYPCTWLAAAAVAAFGAGALVQWLTFVVAIACLALVSAISFRLFEAPYFAARAAAR